MAAVAITPEGGLHTVLLSETDITNLVGSRVYANEAKQSIKNQTHIVFELGATDFNLALDSTGGLLFLDFDIDCKSLSPIDAITLAKAVRTLLQDYTGTWGSGYRCDAVLLGDQFGDVEKLSEGSDVSMFVQTLGFQFQLTEL